MPSKILILSIQYQNRKYSSSLLHQGLPMSTTYGGAKSHTLKVTVNKNIMLFSDL